MPPDKSKEDRLKETLTILHKLEEVGIASTDPGYTKVKELMSEWVRKGGDSASHTIEFPRHGRKGELVLPRRADRAAGLSLKADRNAGGGGPSSSPR